MGGVDYGEEVRMKIGGDSEVDGETVRQIEKGRWR